MIGGNQEAVERLAPIFTALAPGIGTIDRTPGREAMPADVLAASLFARFRSRQEHTFGEKALSAMRMKFGGHVERPS